ncbi:hypothetical protein [Acidiphilium sp.]|uniref:hypothetical protein n=1 Tax=Acidiphilium sp. TaxID=527 RepID=UPI003D051D9A
MSGSKLRWLRPTLLLAALAATLAGCGTEAPHRMGTGTAGGAATGAAFGLIGGPVGVVVGAAIGGGIGALTASTTTPKQIDLDNISPQTTPPSADAAPAGTAASNPGLRNQINQYQAQSPSAYRPPSGYGQSVQAQPLAPPNPQ